MSKTTCKWSLMWALRLIIYSQSSIQEGTVHWARARTFESGSFRLWRISRWFLWWRSSRSFAGSIMLIRSIFWISYTGTLGPSLCSNTRLRIYSSSHSPSKAYSTSKRLRNRYRLTFRPRTPTLSKNTTISSSSNNICSRIEMNSIIYINCKNVLTEKFQKFF